MAGWRDIKAKAKAKVHDTFECPAVYLPALAAAVAKRVNVRVHNRIAPRENEFVFTGAASLLEEMPRLVFRKDQLAMARLNAVVIVSASEIYRLGASEPEKDGYFRVECTRLTNEECAATVANLGTVTGPIWEGVLP